MSNLAIAIIAKCTPFPLSKWSLEATLIANVGHEEIIMKEKHPQFSSRCEMT